MIVLDRVSTLSELSLVASISMKCAMAESSMSLGISETEITALKETLCGQQQLLQKLYNELDVEREASATAATETLSMMLRLQGEKAAVKMEASQYKRITEEKMCYAEESLAIFEDLLYQKEMEIASLDCQVQAYRYKLVSLGVGDLGIGETKFPENLLLRNENLVGDMGVQSIARRNSLPPIPLKYSYHKKGIIERERSASPDLIPKVIEENKNLEKETLCGQQQLLQKLYNELDVEREASATAATETLSMMLRLQGEKAAVKMEASQYKRIAEEKMCYAEESFAIFEDLLYQKEMEIASLDYQVQAYRYKLLSLGVGDLGIGETKFPENLLLRNENLVGDMGVQSIARRNSFPPIPLKYSYHKKGIIERERSASPDLIPKVIEENKNPELNIQNLDMEKKYSYHKKGIIERERSASPEMIPKVIEEKKNQELNIQSLDMEKKPEKSAVGNINSYWEQIRKLDEQVKEIADCTGVKSANLKGTLRPSSLLSQVSTGMLFDPTNGTINTELGEVKHPENLLENEATTSSACSSSVHDVFEVPQTRMNGKGCGQQTKEQRRLNLEGEKRLGKSDSASQETVKLNFKDETDWVKKMQMSTHCENHSLCRSSDGGSVDGHFALVCPTIGHAKFQKLNRTSEIIEVERDAERQESINRGEEELKLLKEIRQQLNSIQSELRTWTTKKSSPPDDLSLVSLTEAMLYFWL